ncbi:hypothetical protein J8F10_28850 [Gemmata sp. G18]|uniref:Zinc finger/thioredoxin putative domain-containing protein n=1 Tax=Gemmata palustris TaxID=2822762 RepID=A0ABS5BZW1_9BACT|nr:hypothetical protein [Gemmata palustris]MBP3959273.1 hypothetical protein [Gemmata palustris]
MIRFNCPNCSRHYELPPALAFLPLVCKQCGHHITPPASEPDPPPPPAPPPVPVQPKPVAPAVPPKAPLPVAKIVAPPPGAKPPTAKLPPPADVKPPVAKPPAPPADDTDVFVTKPDSTPDIDFNVGGPTASSLSDAARIWPPGASDANQASSPELESTVGPTSTTEAHAAPGIDLKLLGPEPPRTPPPSKRTPQPPEPEPELEERPEPTLVPFIADLVAFVVLVVVGMFVGEMLAKKTTGEVLSTAGSAPTFPPPDLLLWGGPPAVFALIYLLLSSRKLSVGEWLRRRRAQ